MPRLSDTMTEGVIAAWHKKVGDTVKKGDLLAEVETDKATMELESYKDGVLLHIGTDKGGKLQVNDLLAIIGSPGEDISSLTKTSSAQPAASSQPAPAEKSAAASPQPAPTEKPAAKPVASTSKAATATTPAIDISKAIMVGNTISDMKFGRNLGVQTVFLPTTRPEVDLDDERIDAVYDSLIDFGRALQKSNTQ